MVDRDVVAEDVGENDCILECQAGALAQVRFHGMSGVTDQHGLPVMQLSWHVGQRVDVVAHDGIGFHRIEQRGDRIVPPAEPTPEIVQLTRRVLGVLLGPDRGPPSDPGS